MKSVLSSLSALRSDAMLAVVTLAVVLLAAAMPPSVQAQESAPPADAETDTAEASGEATAEDETDEEEEDRIRFDVAVEDTKGGGRVSGTAGDIELRQGELLLATGRVELKYRSLELQADTVRLDLRTNLLTAEGDVVLDDGPERLAGTSLEYDLDTQQGKVNQATAYASPDYYFSGRQISKIGERTFTVEDGVFTSCEQEVPSWSIALSRAHITLDEYARIRNARLKFKKLPVLYVPYILWPATTERTSGFLVPKPGYSSRRGASIDLAYYKTLGRTADTTFFADASSKEYFGFGNETRWRPSENSSGYFRGYFLSEPDDALTDFPDRVPFDPNLKRGDSRWKVELFHETKDLWGKFRGVINVEEYSDLDYLQDYERNSDRQTRTFIYSQAYLSSNFGNSSFNVLVDRRERILSSTTENPRNDERFQLPEVEYRLRSTQLGDTPLYFSLRSSLHGIGLDIDTPSFTIDDSYERFNFEPTLSVPLSQLSWLSAKLDLGGRATFYGDTLLPAAETGGAGQPRQLGGGSLERIVPTGSLEIVGPVFSKIFEGGEKGRFSKYKHVIEPRATYAYVDEFDREDQARVFRFDEIDNITPTNGVVFALINRLVAKPRDEEEGGALEIGSLELRQVYSFDDPLQIDRGDPLDDTDDRELQEGPLRLTLRVNPSRRFSVKTDATYSTLYSDLQSLSFTGEKWFGGGDPKSPLGDHKLGLTWFVNQNAATGVTTNSQLRLFTKIGLIPKRLSIDATVSYDLEESKTLQQRYFLNWQSQCYSWQLELRESRFREVVDRDIRFSLTLKNVGTFLDLNESL